MSSIWDNKELRAEMQKRGKSSWAKRVEKYGEEGARQLMRDARAKVEENRNKTSDKQG